LLGVPQQDTSAPASPEKIRSPTSAKPFAWTATADEILAKVRLVEANIKKLVANNAK
jgi:hypothetical protein